MLTTLPILLALSIGSKADVPSRMEVYNRQNARFIEHYKRNPTGFNPTFGKHDVASHPVGFMTFPHMSLTSQANAQHSGLDKTKEMNLQLNRTRLPIVLQMQMQLK